MLLRYGVRQYPVTPTTKAGIAMRAPTIIPAPTVEAEMPRLPNQLIAAFERPNQANHWRFNAKRFETNPTATPPPSFWIERLSRSLSVSARMILATANPEG